MFFESDDLISVYRTALAFCQTDVVARVKARGEYALSFRYRAENAVLRQGNKVFEVKTGDLAFVPRVDYVRTADYDNLAAIHFTILNADFTDIETFSPSDPSVYEELSERSDPHRPTAMRASRRCTESSRISAKKRVVFMRCDRERFCPQPRKSAAAKTLTYLR
ncbi:MAG: hypothetical protein ACLUSP_10905 [Christensenellales bacterium]